MIKYIKILTAIILLFATALPVGFAQEADSAPPSQDAVPPPLADPPAEIPSIIIVEPQTAPAQVQEPLEAAVSPQETAGEPAQSGTKDLEPTFNPSGALLSDGADAGQESSGGDPALPGTPLPQNNEDTPLIPIDEAAAPSVIDLQDLPAPTSAPDNQAIPSSPATLDNSETAAPQSADSPSASSAPEAPKPLAEFNAPALDSVAGIVIKEQKSKFSFKITGKVIAAAKNPDWQIRPGSKPQKNQPASEAEQSSQISQANPAGQTEVTVVPSLASDPKNGLNISGVCEDKYFVVLVYASASSYDVNPASYIYNKAFDCINGQYGYSINDLPETLRAGGYYLLIAEQGDRGPWKPVSGLIFINIEKQ